MKNKQKGFTLYNTNNDTIVFEQGKPITGKLGITINPFNRDGKKANKATHLLTLDDKPCPEHYSLIQLANDIKDNKIKPGTIGRVTYTDAVLDKKGKVKFIKYKIEIQNAKV